ncbi:hypothetical protein GOP47_0028297 [Adiantum capillus-veneris]|nr:hypothetical protein GOP47_0028297 [Adiantum capillus-veneris]
MDNKALLWAKPDKAGILLKRGGEIKTWKKRQFVIKDSYLFYFKVLASVEQSEPTGVIPLQGCKVGTASAGPNTSVQHIFVVTLPEELAGLGILKRTNYVLAAQDFEDMQSWIDAIRLASLSKRKLQAKVDHAYMEVRDLEKRWAVAKERDAYREYGRGAPPLQSQGGEDPIILQALADMLMEAYHTRELLQNILLEPELELWQKRAKANSLLKRVPLQRADTVETWQVHRCQHLPDRAMPQPKTLKEQEQEGSVHCTARQESQNEEVYEIMQRGFIG